MPVLPPVPAGAGVVDWVRTHLGHLSCDEVRASSIRGGQTAADAALANLDVTGYARRRSQVLPVTSRGATRMSPYLRHGLLTLPQVWDAVSSAPPADRTKYRDELMWQEYARHLYARVGDDLARSLRTEPPVRTGTTDPWDRRMACMELVVGDLERDGWLVNQTRMWLASQWSVRGGRAWEEGEDRMYRHLLDGSRAANRLGWQWTTGAGTAKPYGFSRWQVEKRAPGLCQTCPLTRACPVQEWPDAEPGRKVEPPASLADATDGGPATPQLDRAPEVVWLTAESLGSEDPAATAHPDLPRVFVFDKPLLARLRLSGKRLVFLAEALAELDVEVRLGDPVTELAGTPLAVTFAPVPGFRRRRAALDVVALHPWPWLRRPGSGSLRSFSAFAR